MAAYKDRIERLELLVNAIPAKASAEDSPDPGLLLARMAEHYADRASKEAQRRAIQRDLEELVKEARLEVVNPGGKPLRYRRIRDGVKSDPLVWAYAQKALRAVIQDALPSHRLDVIWRHLLDEKSDLGLGDDKLRIVTDTQRLLPADIREGVLADVLEALASSRTLKAGYRDAEGKFTQPVLHPQALLQRGPRLYLYALKNDEDEPVRMYALHRFTRTAVAAEEARSAQGFDLQTAIDRGQADFANGETVELVLRARGYVAGLLRDCPLCEKQRIEDEEEGSDFELRVLATVPQTGQLLRWLLGCGDKLEVLEPLQLRRVIAAQTANAAGLYRNGPSANEGADLGGISSAGR